MRHSSSHNLNQNNLTGNACEACGIKPLTSNSMQCIIMSLGQRSFIDSSDLLATQNIHSNYSRAAETDWDVARVYIMLALMILCRGFVSWSHANSLLAVCLSGDVVSTQSLTVAAGILLFVVSQPAQRSMLSHSHLHHQTPGNVYTIFLSIKLLCWPLGTDQGLQHLIHQHAVQSDFKAKSQT